jgi:glycosyltransferase involved in cell wall biosynthesis
MKELSRSPARRAAMGHAGRKRYEDCFRAERYVKEFEKVYREMIEDS